jgi:hypothetical protein
MILIQRRVYGRALSAITLSILMIASLPRVAAMAEELDGGCDFDGDGYAEMVIPAPFNWNWPDGHSSGDIYVLSGSDNGVVLDGFLGVRQNGSLEGGDEFGRAWVCGNFDGDPYADLAVGSPGEDMWSWFDAGAVHVFYGSPVGLEQSNSDVWSQASPGFHGGVETNDRFGSSLAAGDFDGDGDDDLVIGVPQESFGNVSQAGVAHILHGSTSGLTTLDMQTISQSSPGIHGGIEYIDRFGLRLTTGDFDGDGFQDLVIGVPMEDLGSIKNAGDIHVVYGSVSGLDTYTTQTWTQGTAGLSESPEIHDWFGWGLSAGDIDGDGHDDLAIGVASEELDGEDGVVHILYGSAAGLDATGAQLLSSATSGLDTSVVSELGRATVLADFDGDGYADLATSSDIRPTGGAGRIHVLNGSSGGLNTDAALLITQDSPGIDEEAEIEDRFGFRMSAADFDGDGYADLNVRVPYEGVFSNNYVWGWIEEENAGAVHALYGSAFGLTSSGAHTFTGDTLGNQNSWTDSGDLFGFSNN